MSYLLTLTLLLTPAYAVKFNLLGFSANVLMLWVGLFWIIFLGYLAKKKELLIFFAAARKINKKILSLIAIFFASGVIALFINGFDRPKLGQFIVLFFQPISMFFIGRYLIGKFPAVKPYLLTTIYFLLAASGLYAIVQYLTLFGLPPAWWGNSVEPKRAISFFIHPNFYALFAAPLLAFLIPDVLSNLKSKIINLKSSAWTVGAAGLLLSMSRAGWLGLAVAVVVYLIFAADQKIRRVIFAAIFIAIIVIVAVPNLKWRIIGPIYSKEPSAYSRLTLWQSGWQAVKTSPILGLGLNGYANNYRTFQTDQSLDTHNFPHNIFLDLWVETGLMGLISLTGLMGVYVYGGLKNRQDVIKLGVSLFLLALLVQGQIDNPYFKNDLAMVFWIILALG